jgi:hypothetical protein
MMEKFFDSLSKYKMNEIIALSATWSGVYFKSVKKKTI